MTAKGVRPLISQEAGATNNSSGFFPTTTIQRANANGMKYPMVQYGLGNRENPIPSKTPRPAKSPTAIVSTHGLISFPLKINDKRSADSSLWHDGPGERAYGVVTAQYGNTRKMIAVWNQRF